VEWDGDNLPDLVIVYAVKAEYRCYYRVDLAPYNPPVRWVAPTPEYMKAAEIAAIIKRHPEWAVYICHRPFGRFPTELFAGPVY